MKNTKTPEKEIFVTFNEITRRMEKIYIDEAELVEGQGLIKMFWSSFIGKYCTVPGDSLYRVNADLDIELCDSRD